ncbi:MAG TPA: hypothetical protein VHZ51_30670 [Ktedonobacteraceae bacterium]|nr:hypothetical protein [Ktedonobacteraceae bacterium]
MPRITNYIYNAGNANSLAASTPVPDFPAQLPQVGSLLYTVQDGDSCDSLLAMQMHMYSASHVFSDANAVTVQALNKAVGHDCHQLQPGLTIRVSPQYPLVALGGVVQKITSTSGQQAVPTPLIQVTRTEGNSVDCSGGCQATVRVAPNVQVKLRFQTELPIHVGSWVWAQARLARKHVPNFNDYPYADPRASLNGMTMPVCDLQVDNKHDDNSAPCDSLTPNTVDEDQGAWLFGVVAPGSLKHWHYPLHLANGTRVLLWLTNNNGALTFQRGNPVYRYDAATNLYVKP